MNDPTDLLTWRDAWRTLPNLLPPERAVAHAALGTEHPDWERRRAASYPDRLVLYALAVEDELRANLPRAGILPGMRVLDAACGPGIVSRFLVEAGVAHLVGVDLDPAMLELARTFPAPPGAMERLTFQQADLKRPLPFPDRSFDAVWLGDAWFPEESRMLDELIRVVRPGGSVIVKIGGIGMGRTYAWDHDFEARIQLALQRGQAGRRWTGRTGLHNVGLYGCLRTAAHWTALDVWSVLVERFAPVPEVYEQYLLQGFALFFGGFIKGAVAPEDWETIARLYDPRSTDYLLRRPDGHFLQTLTFARCVVDG